MLTNDIHGTILRSNLIAHYTRLYTTFFHALFFLILRGLGVYPVFAIPPFLSLFFFFFQSNPLLHYLGKNFGEFVSYGQFFDLLSHPLGIAILDKTL